MRTVLRLDLTILLPPPPSPAPPSPPPPPPPPQLSLTRGNNLLTRCTIHDWSQWKRTYQPGISWGGVGNNYTHNQIFSAPHAGILGAGLSHNNLPRQTNKETSKQTHKQTNKQASKQTNKNKQTSKQTHRQTNKQAST